MRIALGVVLLSFLLARPVAADDTAKRVAAIKALLATQAAAWRDGGDADEARFKATLTPDGRLAHNGDWLRPDITLSPPYNISKFAITSTQIGWSGTWGWVVAEIHLTSQMFAEPAGAGNPHPKPEASVYHWIELVVADGDQVKGRAVGIYAAKPDKALEDMDFVQDLVPLASPSPILAALARAKDLPKLLATDPATTVFGTSADETALGLAAAKKLVGGWGKLGLEPVDTKDKDDKLFYTPVELAVGDATVVWGRIRMKLPGKPRGFLLDVFAIARKTATGFELVAVSYSG